MISTEHSLYIDCIWSGHGSRKNTFVGGLDLVQIEAIGKGVVTGGDGGHEGGEKDKGTHDVDVEDERYGVWVGVSMGVWVWVWVWKMEL